MLDALKGRIGAFDPHAGPLGEVGDEALAGRVTRSIEETTGKNKHEELPEKQSDRMVSNGISATARRSSPTGWRSETNPAPGRRATVRWWSRGGGR